MESMRKAPLRGSDDRDAAKAQANRAELPTPKHSSRVESPTHPSPAGGAAGVTCVLRYDGFMKSAPTGAARYLARRLEDPEYRQAYNDARTQIDQIDSVIRAFDARREELHLTKAELARRAGVKPEAIRRLLSAEKPNPTLSTLVALAGALDLEIRPVAREATGSARARSVVA